MNIFKVLLALVKTLVASRAALAAESLVLRHQLMVLKLSVKKPRLCRRDRIFWVYLSRVCSGWRSVLVVVRPQTVVRWHRTAFRMYWRWKSRAERWGRPRIPQEIWMPIRNVSSENVTWGAPRIQSELRLLGYEVEESTVAKYMFRPRKPPSQTLRTFLENHVQDLAAIDFLTVPTVTFRVLLCFVVLRHDRRRVVHFNVTANPTAIWTAQQIVEAFPYDEVPRHLIRDRNSIYSEFFKRRVKGMRIEEVVIAPKAPWQNPLAKLWIGSIRRECLDHVIVLGEGHIRSILHDYFAYYHVDRTHSRLGRNAPFERLVESPDMGKVVSEPRPGGLHPRCRRVA